jgi:hypothetical protein
VREGRKEKRRKRREKEKGNKKKRKQMGKFYKHGNFQKNKIKDNL